MSDDFGKADRPREPLVPMSRREVPACPAVHDEHLAVDVELPRGQGSSDGDGAIEFDGHRATPFGAAVPRDTMWLTTVQTGSPSAAAISLVNTNCSWGPMSWMSSTVVVNTSRSPRSAGGGVWRGGRPPSWSTRAGLPPESAGGGRPARGDGRRPAASACR